jgi:hypothetical protein
MNFPLFGVRLGGRTTSPAGILAESSSASDIDPSVKRLVSKLAGVPQLEFGDWGYVSNSMQTHLRHPLYKAWRLQAGQAKPRAAIQRKKT